MLARKMLPEYVYDTSQLENNPITFPEVKTLIDGITIGGHKIEDVEQILNIKTAWNLLLTDIKNRNLAQGASTISQQLIKNTHLSSKKTFSRKNIFPLYYFLLRCYNEDNGKTTHIF